MELVANIWPIVDEASLLIQRFAARAYVIAGGDSEVGATLKTLSQADFMVARQFAVPKHFTIVTEDGQLEGTVTVDAFNQNQPAVIEHALNALESEKQSLQGIGFDSQSRPFYKHIQVRFPAEPYLAITFLTEDRVGNLRVHSTN